MFAKLFVLFAIIPIIESALLIEVSDHLGGWNTVALVLITAFIGAQLVRQQGFATLQKAQQRMAKGEMPGQQMIEGALLMVAGVLLVTPGFVTDGVGFVLLLPLTRPMIARKLLKALGPHIVMHARGAHVNPQGQRPFEDDGQTIDGEFTRHQEPHQGLGQDKDKP